MSGLDDNSVRIWNVKTAKIERVIGEHSREVTSGAFSGDGTRVVSASRDASIRIWNAATEEVEHVEGDSSWVTSICCILA